MEIADTPESSKGSGVTRGVPQQSRPPLPRTMHNASPPSIRHRRTTSSGVLRRVSYKGEGNDDENEQEISKVYDIPLSNKGAPEAVDRFGIPFAEHHLKGQGNVGHLGFQTGVPPIVVQRSNRARPPLHPTTSRKSSTGVSANNQKRTVVTLTDPLHDLRQIPGGDEQTRKVYVAKADEERDNRVEEEKKAVDSLDPPLKAWPITSFLVFRIPGAAIYLIICAALAATIYTWSLAWIKSEDTFPLFQCPSSSVIEHDVNVDGTYCQLTFSFDNITNYRAAAVGFQKDNGVGSTCWIPSRYQYEDCGPGHLCYVRCNAPVSCTLALNGPSGQPSPKPFGGNSSCAKTVKWGADENDYIDRGCTQTIYLQQDQATTVPQTAIAVQPYCDLGSTVSPADIIGIRGIFLGALLPGNGACTWDVDGRRNLVRCLSRLLEIGLPARQIFVVDCGSALTPVDDTWRVIHTVVSPDINYSYLPENNRILGAYWANKIWIPYAGKKTTMGSGGGGELKSGNSGVFEPKSNGGINSTFRYALMIDDIETVLPSTFDLHSLNLEETRPAAVHFPVTIDPRNRPSQDLAKFADMQLLYQLTLIRFQSQFFGAVLSTQRGVSLWHRGTLDKVLYEHGTEPFSVSNLYAGLLMLRQRDEDTIELAEELAPQTFGKSPYVWKGAGPHGNSGDHHHAERQLSEEMEPGSSDGRRGGLTDGEISTPHHIGGHRTRVVHTPTGHSPVVDPRVPPPLVQRSPRSRPPLHPSTPRRSRPGMLGSSPRSWAQSGGEARSQLPSSTASSSERGQQMVDEEKGKEAVEVVEDAAAGGVVEANTGGENGASDESFYDGEYLGAGPIEQGGNQPPRFRADTFKSDGGESDFNSDAEGSAAGDGEIGGRGRLVGKGGVPVSTDRSFGAILKQERQYLRARTPPPFLSPLPEIVRVLGAIIALVLAVGVAVTIMVGSFGWIHAAYRRRVQASWTEQANREHRRLLEKQAEEQHSDTDSVKSPQSVFSVDVDSPSGLRSNVHMAFEHGNLQDLAGGLVKTVDEEGNPIHPYARFQSKEWRARVSVALLEIQYRAKTALRRGVFYWALTLILSWLLLFLCCLLVVAVFPDQVYPNSGKLDLWDYIRNGADGESVPAVAVIDWLVLLDGLILTILAFLPALLSSCWPPLPVSRKGREGRSVSESVNAAVAGGVPMGVLGEGNEQSGELVTDVCVIVAMRSGCCTDPVKRGRVRKILRRCTTLLPPKVHGCSPIFVVEVGEGLSPADDCCKMIQDFVSPDVNYAYLPEDNKAMAIYWANKSWIPSVLRWANPQENRNSAFRYALLITDADSDDDMMLPVALDLNTQKYRREGTKVVWYMPTVRGVSNMPSVTLRDYIVKQRAIMSFTQEKLGGSCVVTPLKAVSLWDRAALHKTLAGFVGVNDTHSPGLLQPSLMMEQYLRHDFETCMGGSQIRTDTGSSNFASECGRWYFRLRMFVVAFVPTIRLKGCCSREALVGRIWSFIADVVPTIVIILRPFLLVSIFVRQPALIGVYFGIYFVIFHGISVALMAITLRNRRDVRRQWNWFTASIIFPFYKIYQYVVDIYPALLHVMFSVNRVPGGRQSTRTGASMPLPPAKDVDWFTVWRASSHSASSLPNADPEPSSAQRRKYKNRRKNDQ
ncbi:hypothetical protein Pmar_PMAR006569 [Perkinsus marinus ATCC 50983]|uniref:Uncharacterized protein n=1 Tax=Perkinsus marinus (strain ATCC 50983 / TXsc) TaxID=423536 RepID=C5LTT2_PERM5|nr:hypothetical protein Pmar_PMAR006569 [Perkinsus marinus ATCC 50983]EEQ99894.1 hypothetical protein Pmar_PMAR006569 [Perkinsus marinus ATCC 50983]|eukprot:XP_002767177.1 hypothetical protein Pmar_PMAR006569 [Perkinsus marinus ATCC 50983]